MKRLSICLNNTECPNYKKSIENVSHVIRLEEEKN